jgi:hypothetical protein
VTVTDFAHEAAKRFSAVIMNRDRVEQFLERRAPAGSRAPEGVDVLVERLRRVVEAELVERFTVAELSALARFYGTPEGSSLARKGLAFTAALGPMLEAEIVAWAQSIRPNASADGAEAAAEPAP